MGIAACHNKKLNKLNCRFVAADLRNPGDLKLLYKPLTTIGKIKYLLDEINCFFKERV